MQWLHQISFFFRSTHCVFFYRYSKAVMKHGEEKRPRARLTWISDADKKATVKSGLGKVWPPLIRWMACKKTSWPGMTRRSRTWADRWFAPAITKSNIRWSVSVCVCVCVRLTDCLYLHLYLNQKKCDKGWSSSCGPREPLQEGNTNAN